MERLNLMPNMLTDITQEQYNQIANRYMAKINMDFLYYAMKAIEILKAILTEKAIKNGYKLEQVGGKGSLEYLVVRPETNRESLFDFWNVKITELLEKVLAIDSETTSKLCDVKIAIPEYLIEKCREIVNQHFEKNQGVVRTKLTKTIKK